MSGSTPGFSLLFSVAKSCPTLCDTMDCAARQASLSFTISGSLLKLMCIESVMPSNHLILCRSLLPPSIFQFSSVQSLSHVRLFATPWTAARQVSLSITNSQSLLKLMSIESVMPSNHLILCRSLLPPSIFQFSSVQSLSHVRLFATP